MFVWFTLVEDFIIIYKTVEVGTKPVQALNLPTNIQTVYTRLTSNKTLM